MAHGGPLPAFSPSLHLNTLLCLLIPIPPCLGAALSTPSPSGLAQVPLQGPLTPRASAHPGPSCSPATPSRPVRSARDRALLRWGEDVSSGPSSAASPDSPAQSSDGLVLPSPLPCRNCLIMMTSANYGAHTVC